MKISRALLRALGFGLVSVGLPVVVVVAAGEAWIRLSTPLFKNSWPTRFDPSFGWTFVPGSEVRWTNRTDFSIVTRANSLGFLDREPRAGAKPPGTCRVVFLGDSFVEAAQVPMEQKVQVVFERLASVRFPDRRFDTAAFGYSGTGQANQVPFYDVFARPLRPDVVVLVVVDNDFANNSPLLESLRHGWTPLKPPRRFYEEQADGTFRAIPIAADWHQYLLPAPDDPTSDTRLRRLDRWMSPRSAFWGWITTHLRVKYPAFARRLAGPSISQTYAFRLAHLREDARFAHRFDGWRWPQDLDFDTMFYADDMPPIFHQALRETGHAFGEFRARARADGFALIALSTYGLSKEFPGTRKVFGRTLMDAGYRVRLERLLAEQGIPLVDQYAHLVAAGGRAVDAHFPHDGHWSLQGHRWAAEAVLRHFEAHPELCRPAPGG